MSSPAVAQLPHSSSSTLILPYGYQIDLDFIKYCEKLANVDHTDAELQRRNRRRQRQSMEVMLGIQLEMQQQMNQNSDVWEERRAPEPPPRTHLHAIESPIVPKYNAARGQREDAKWDPALCEVVSDFERTLERSKKVREVAGRNGVRVVDTCIPSSNAPSTAAHRPPRKSQQSPRSEHQSPLKDCHVSIESIDGSSLTPSQAELQRLAELEEQTKLIPLLQLQIEKLKDERSQLLQQLEASRASSAASSSSSHQQQPPAQFQVQRISPVSLSSMKLNANVIARRSVGVNTVLLLSRDVGVMSERPHRSNASTLTDFHLACDASDGGRLYSEKDLKKTVELVHAKMRRAMVSVGVQHSEERRLTRDIAVGAHAVVRSFACNTDEPLVTTAPSVGALSLRDLGKSPATRTSCTQTSHGAVVAQAVQATPHGAHKSTDSADLIARTNRAVGTEAVHRRDQVSHTGDLVVVHSVGSNTAAEKVVLRRTTASNTDDKTVRSVGVSADIEAPSKMSLAALGSSTASRAASEELEAPARPLSRTTGQFDLSDMRPAAARSSIERILRHDTENYNGGGGEGVRRSFKEMSPYRSGARYSRESSPLGGDIGDGASRSHGLQITKTSSQTIESTARPAGNQGSKPSTTPLRLTSNIPTLNKASPQASATTTTTTTTTVTQLTRTTIDPISISHSDSSSKIPRPSPNPTRKYVRQDTFTVTTSPPQSLKSPTAVNISSVFGFKKSAEGGAKGGKEEEEVKEEEERVEEEKIADECPVERMLKLSLSHRRSPSPPRVEKSPETERHSEDAHENPPESTSQMVQSPSVEYLDDDEEVEEEDDDDDEYDEDEFNDEQVPSSGMPLRPPPTSISTIRLVREGRVRIKPTKEMVAALKVINDHLEKHPEPVESQIVAAREIAACEWFRVSSTENANPDNVEDYLDYFEEQSWELLSFMVNLADKNGNMAMHYAVSHGNFDVVSLLLDSKVCNINQTNNAGYTCIMLVSLAKLVIDEHRTVVQRLFKLADVNIRATKNSQTALMLAVSHGNVEIVQMMVEAGADINIQDDDGSTALMCASEQGHLDIVKFLLAQPDCDSTKQDVDGNTALKISLEAGYHDIGCLLYAHEHLIRSKAGVRRASSRKSSTSSLT